MIQNSICEVSITQILKVGKDMKKKKTNITHEQRYKNPQQNIGKPNSTIH